jgi:hypothetical protein
MLSYAIDTDERWSVLPEGGGNLHIVALFLAIVDEIHQAGNIKI